MDFLLQVSADDLELGDEEERNAWTVQAEKVRVALEQARKQQALEQAKTAQVIKDAKEKLLQGVAAGAVDTAKKKRRTTTGQEVRAAAEGEQPEEAELRRKKAAEEGKGDEAMPDAEVQGADASAAAGAGASVPPSQAGAVHSGRARRQGAEGCPLEDCCGCC